MMDLSKTQRAGVGEWADMGLPRDLQSHPFSQNDMMYAYHEVDRLTVLHPSGEPGLAT